LVPANANGPGGHPIWTKLATNALKPGPRCSQTAVYDTVNNRMMVFGGENADAVYYVRTHSRGCGLGWFQPFPPSHGNNIQHSLRSSTVK